MSMSKEKYQNPNTEPMGENQSDAATALHDVLDKVQKNYPELFNEDEINKKDGELHHESNDFLLEENNLKNEEEESNK